MPKLTAAQRRVLAALAKGDILFFDRGDRLPQPTQLRSGKKVRNTTAEALWQLHVIRPSVEGTWYITDAGRKALEEATNGS